MLYQFSMWYCAKFEIYFNAHVADLPFGLVLKWTDRTSLGEVAAMKLAREAGMPVPKVVCCGEHGEDFRRISILMTRLPGFDLENSDDELDVDAEGPWIHELKTCIQSMRLWTSPFSDGQICSVNGTSIRSSRVPHHVMGPFKNETEFHQFLFAPASMHGFESREDYDNALSRARKLQEKSHRLVFTHGDLKSHNILIDDDGHLSGLLDWESGGWCPDYWDFTTAMRFGRSTWWFQVCSWMGGDQYLEELDADIALNLLTVDSYAGM